MIGRSNLALKGDIMNKSDLIFALSKETGLPVNRAEEAVKTVFNGMADARGTKPTMVSRPRCNMAEPFHGAGLRNHYRSMPCGHKFKVFFYREAIDTFCSDRSS